MQNLKLFITGHKGFETLLFHELRDILGSSSANLEKKYGGVEISAGIETVYRVCLHSRLANRVFCELGQAQVEDETQLYQAVYQIDWGAHLNARDSIAVSATVSRSRLDHTHFVALKAKDAIVDQFRENCGSRPVVEKKQPDFQVHINIHHNQASISLDLSGESLHRRGYRLQHSGAPLKEHLAAALLMQAGWDQRKDSARRLVDPMCGSGTFAIEAAMMAANIAPGLQRSYFGFNKWLLHQPELWQACIDHARQAIEVKAETMIYASDYDAGALEIARANAKRAQVDRMIEFSHQQVGELELPPAQTDTLVICNPPWGRRLQGEQDLGRIYADLGNAVQRLAPANLAIISANADLLHRLKLKRISRKEFKNGPLECLFAIFATVGDNAAASVDPAVSVIADEIALPLRNRLAKNAKHLQRWARRNGISCYRIYDADLPEFAFALDRYQSEIAPEVEWYHLQEYQAPATIEADKAEYRIGVAADVVRELFSIPDDRLFCKTRSRQRGSSQYQKQDSKNEFYQVREGEASLLINLSDYLDSGLFLDHRITRELVYQRSAGKSVLNLFCYTGAVGVQAGLGGASSIVNVDLSATYLKWARENHLLNGLDDEIRYQFLRADIVELLNKPERFALQQPYDLIFFDPPSFSNSSKMQQTLDIQRDHEDLIRLAMDLLAPDGLLLFSTNRRSFKLAEATRQSYSMVDISHSTIAEDFKRNPKIHRCWEIRHQL
jgi:23S rRNA (guanine2445-N2)-methyltransferase / 23S rRNA (guanine2069-N7)-methyltransferase